MNQQIINRLFDFTHLKKVKDIDLAPILNADRAYISHIRNGKKKLSFDKFELIYTTFTDLDLNWLFRGKPLKTETEGIISAYFGSNSEKINEVEKATLETENRYLKEIINEKNKQIELLQKLTK